MIKEIVENPEIFSFLETSIGISQIVVKNLIK